MKGVILAAGYATRFLPASKTIPKEMFPLIDWPVIDFIVQEMVDSVLKTSFWYHHEEKGFRRLF